jgi:mannose-6-phosphate isomerase-like protein (cupin superfamily)
MKHVHAQRRRRGLFNLILQSSNAQAAMMVLAPGRSSSDAPENEHPRSEQWLYVVSGTGRATTGRRRVALRAGSLLLIEKDEPHQVTCTGNKPLVTLNLYVPPAYTSGGDVKLLAKRPSVTKALRRLVDR